MARKFGKLQVIQQIKIIQVLKLIEPTIELYLYTFTVDPHSLGP